MQHEAKQAGPVLVGIILAVILHLGDRYEPNTFIRRDGSFYATISAGLVEHLSLDQRLVQPQSWYSGTHPGYANLDVSWSNVSLGNDGAWYPKHSFLISVAAAPFYAAFGVFGFLIFNGLCTVAMLWAGYLIAARYAPPAASAAAVFLTALSPMILEHTYHLSADVFNAGLIAFGALALLHKRPTWAGILLGMGLWSRPVTAGLVVPVALALVWRRFDKQQLIRFLFSLSVPLSAAALTNTLMYGAPWVTSYDRVLTISNRAAKVVSARELYTNEFVAGLHLMFDNREHGLFAHSLPSVAALVGIIPLWRHSRALALALFTGMIGFVAAYVFYQYFHARFFFAWQILLCLPLAVLINDVAQLSTRAGQRARGPLARARMAAMRAPRWALGVLLFSIGGTVTVYALDRAGRTYVLSEHIREAQVFRNGYPCDYFNFTVLAWECSRLDRDPQALTGMAIGSRPCEFDGGPWEALTIAPTGDGGERRMRFENLPKGPLDLEYGLHAGVKASETCFSVAYGGGPTQRVCAKGRGKRTRRRFEAMAGGSRSLEIIVDGRGPRSLCFDGVIRAGR